MVENTQISPGMFVLYLHENYNDFFDDLDDIVSEDYVSTIVSKYYSLEFFVCTPYHF